MTAFHNLYLLTIRMCLTRIQIKRLDGLWNALSNVWAIKGADFSPLRIRRGSARIRADFRRTSGGSAGCTFRADSSGPAADSADVRRGPKNPPRIRCGSATSTRRSGGLIFQKEKISPLVLANKCSRRTNVRRVADPLRIHQNSSPRIRSGLVRGELFESTGVRHGSAVAVPQRIRFRGCAADSPRIRSAYPSHLFNFKAFRAGWG